MNVEALIISTDEPQMQRCIDSVRNQTVPFSKVTHVNNVMPEHVAFNYGMKIVTEEWVMPIGGDFILYPNALETALDNMSDIASAVFMHSFRLRDKIIEKDISGISVMRSSVMRSRRNRNLLRDDWETAHRLQRDGWKRVIHGDVVLGTHCEGPSDYQIFRKLFITAIKFDMKITAYSARKVLRNFGIEKYCIATDAINFARIEGRYKGSHNASLDKEIYEKFKQYREINNAQQKILRGENPSADISGEG